MNDMTEDMKNVIIHDALEARKWQTDKIETSIYIIKLVRTLDNYRKRDARGRFVKGKEV